MIVIVYVIFTKKFTNKSNFNRIKYLTDLSFTTDEFFSCCMDNSNVFWAILEVLINTCLRSLKYFWPNDPV